LLERLEKREAEALEAAGGPPPEPWEQQPGEPEKAFGRFLVYLRLGPTRTLTEAARMAGGRSSGGKYSFGGNWSRYCTEWHWRDRARAWDLRERELLAISERNVRLALHLRRVEMVIEDTDLVRAALHQAKLDASTDTATALEQAQQFWREIGERK
jgi:hypothetical protein